MVAYKPSAKTSTDRYDYHRLFIEGTYDSLRHIFWDTSNQDFNPNISQSALLTHCKQHNGKEVSDQSTLVDIMFGSYGRADGQFCLVPLKDTGREAIQAFRDIYNLAFATTTIETEVLPSAISALIEMQRGREQEKLDSRLIDAYNDYEQLKMRKLELENLEVNESRYEAISSSFDQLNTKIEDHSLQVHALHSWLERTKKSINPSLDRAIKVLDLEINKCDELIAQLNVLANERKEPSSILMVREKDQQHKEMLKVKCEQLLGRYPNHSISEVIEIEREFADDANKTLDALRNKDELEGRWQTLNHKYNQAVKTLEKKRDSLEHQTDLLMNRVTKQSSQILHIINPRLNEIHTSHLNEDQIARIEAFTNLFSVNEHCELCLGSQPTSELMFKPFDPEQLIRDLQKDVQSQENIVQNLEIRLKELKKLLAESNSQQMTEKNIIELQKQLKDCETAIKDLQHYESTKADLENIKLEIEQANQDITKIDAKIGSIKTVLEPLEKNVEALKGQKVEIANLAENLKNIGKDLSYTLNYTWLHTEHSEDDINHAISELPKEHREIKTLVNLTNQNGFALNEALNKYKMQFKDFMNKVPNSSIEAHIENPSIDQLKSNLQKYKNIFTTLRYQRSNFNNDVQTHNKALQAQVSEITNAKDQLGRQVLMINEKLNNHQISNLKEIKLKLKTKADFDSLNKTLNKFDVHGETLSDETLYTSLLTFFNKNQSSTTGRLRMINLIDSITYQYTLLDDTVVDTSQSGGTTTTITAFVLSILLSEIKEKDMQVHLPIIVDEINTLDATNSNTVINQIAEHGFSIFCATPEFTATVANNVGRFLYIGDVNPKNIMLPSCQLHVLPEHIEYFGENCETPA